MKHVPFLLPLCFMIMKCSAWRYQSTIILFPKKETHSIEIKLITVDAEHICSTLNHHKQLVYMLFAL